MNEEKKFDNTLPFSLPHRSTEWECHLFGSIGREGIIWIPPKDGIPNWFWRKMQYLILGNKWVKQKYDNRDSNRN